MFALHSDTVVHFLRGQGFVAIRLLSTPPRDIAIPAIVEYELHRLAAHSRAPKVAWERISTLIGCVASLPFDKVSAGIAARIAPVLERTETRVVTLDAMVAGICIAAGATLVTSRPRSFSGVPELTVEDWCA